MLFVKMSVCWSSSRLSELRLKVRTGSVLQLSALSKFSEMASSNSQEQEPDNNY